jgi:hypothetical protein
MDLLDRYLQAVKKHLPWQRQDDIIAELRANLESQLEDKEAELGRPLTAGEAETWLKQLGPPIHMAARYQPQQYLIGPAFFPIYWYVLRMAFFWTLIVYAIISAVPLFVGDTSSWAAAVGAVFRIPAVLVSMAAWITFVFACIEFAVTRYPAKCPPLPGFPIGPSTGWSPGTLPPLEKGASPGKKPRSFAQAIAEVIFGFLLLGWLFLIPHHPYLLLGPGAAFLRSSPFQLAPVWIEFFWCLVVLNLLQQGWRIAHLLDGSWRQPQTAQLLVIKALSLVPLVLLLTVRDHVLVTLKHPALDQDRYGGTLNSINQGANRVLLLICAIVVLQLVLEIGWRSLNAYRKRAAAIR